MARKSGAGGIILLAVLLGVLTTYLLWTYKHQMDEKDEKNWLPVVVARAEIPPKTVITEAMLEVQPYPKTLTQDVPFIAEKKDIIGRTSANKINAHDMIRGSDLLQPGQSLGLSYKIPDGMRAVTIGGDEIKFVAAAVFPGDHIDIVASYYDTRIKQDVTRTILQDVLVLMVNRSDADNGGNNNGKATGALTSMTLAVRPEQTELLKAAERSGTMSVSLRNPNDKAVVTTTGITPRSLSSADQADDAPPTIITNIMQQSSPPLPPSRPAPSKESDVKVYRSTDEPRTYIITPAQSNQ
jgi:pilus assembly protein CpaB